MESLLGALPRVLQHRVILQEVLVENLIARLNRLYVVLAEQRRVKPLVVVLAADLLWRFDSEAAADSVAIVLPLLKRAVVIAHWLQSLQVVGISNVELLA